MTYVTCISLHRRADRRREVERVMRPHFPHMNVFSAVDGSDPNVHIRGDITRRMNIMHTQRTPPIDVAKRCKAACWMSHVTVIEDAIHNDAFPHLILEDDIEFENGTSDIAFDNLPDDSVTFLTGLINDTRMSGCETFTRKRSADPIAARLHTGVNVIDKTRFRITSTSAYYVPTVHVAQQLVGYLNTLPRISHVDRDICDAPCSMHILFPSPFRTNMSLATTTDIIPSQTQLFTCRYVPVIRRPRIVSTYQ